MVDWENLKRICGDCTRCGLCETRKNVGIGVGNPSANVMFVGEGPGEQEDKQETVSTELTNRKAPDNI